jgi:hypothetical protein
VSAVDEIRRKEEDARRRGAFFATFAHDLDLKLSTTPEYPADLNYNDQVEYGRGYRAELERLRKVETKPADN